MIPVKKVTRFVISLPKKIEEVGDFIFDFFQNDVPVDAIECILDVQFEEDLIVGAASDVMSSCMGCSFTASFCSIAQLTRSKKRSQFT